MISNWEDAKKRSNYHFNKKIKDTDNVKHIGRFVGTWKDEVDNVINDTKKLIGVIEDYLLIDLTMMLRQKKMI